MGPECPHCKAIYEWTVGEIEEVVYCPKTYICSSCYGMFILSPEEIVEIQARAGKWMDDWDKYDRDNAKEEDKDIYDG